MTTRCESSKSIATNTSMTLHHITKLKDLGCDLKGQLTPLSADALVVFLALQQMSRSEMPVAINIHYFARVAKMSKDQVYLALNELVNHDLIRRQDRRLSR
jgi:hypothetical protein